MAGAAAKKMTNRLHMLLAKDKKASGHLMHGSHACLVPANYATTNVFKQLQEKQRPPAERVPAIIAICCCCCHLFYQICSVRRWMNTTLITKEPPFLIQVRSSLESQMFYSVGTSYFVRPLRPRPPQISAYCSPFLTDMLLLCPLCVTLCIFYIIAITQHFSYYVNYTSYVN